MGSNVYSKSLYTNGVFTPEQDNKTNVEPSSGSRGGFRGFKPPPLQRVFFFACQYMKIPTDLDPIPPPPSKNSGPEPPTHKEFLDPPLEPVHSYDAYDKPGVKGIIGMHRFNICLVVVLSLSCSGVKTPHDSVSNLEKRFGEHG